MYRHTPRRQDTLELRDHRDHEGTQQYQPSTQEQQLDYQHQQQMHHQGHNLSDEEHSVLEDDSGDEQYIEDEDDASSSLSIPSETIDFDLVYSIQTFVATVEGQANVVKGDSLFLMDDSNSYWWLVRVLKTQEVGYIPAENIETPFERLARLNKHRNVDLASVTPQDRQDDVKASRERLRRAMEGTNTPYRPHNKSVIFTGSFVVHNYPPFKWGNEGEEIESELGEETEEEWDEEEGPMEGMEPDDGMSWDEGTARDAQRLQATSPANDTQDPRNQQQQLAANINGRQAAGQSQAQQPRNGTNQVEPTTQQSQLGLGAAPDLRSQMSRERIISGPQDPSLQNSGSRQFVDPAEASVTRQISITPSVARGPDVRQEGKGSTSPSTVAQGRSNSQQGLSRSVSGDSTTSLTSRTSESGKMKLSADNASTSSKTKKSGRSTPDDDSGGEGSGKKEKKKSGLFKFFGGGGKNSKDKKEKDNKKAIASSDADSGSYDRPSEDSGAPSVTTSPGDARTSSLASRRPQIDTTDLRRPQGGKENQPISTHASRVAQNDLQQQARYQEYLNRSPASPPDPSLSWGLQTAASQGYSLGSASSQNLTPGTPRARPGSLIITGNGLEGALVPELSVMRVFAGERLQSEATFKTVLLNASTTASDLVRQAMQRFRLPHGEEEGEYYLTVRQYEGDEAILKKDERPLQVFESLVENTLDMPTVKRSSISSISSNLSIQPAIEKLAMNDFTDDSAVKFYLNRRPSSDGEYGSPEHTDDSAATSARTSDLVHEPEPATDPITATMNKLNGGPRPQLSLHVGGIVTPERFSSPTTRFAIQVVVYPEDLPDGMVFDPQTEAIIPKSSLNNRTRNTGSSNVNQNQRKKVFIFPKNTTVAEVIEQSLDMFGIQDGVVDGGDEVEDKALKRRSASRVRYGLMIGLPGTPDRELPPSSKVLDAFPRPPAFKHTNRRSADTRRRSVDSSQMLGSMEDIQPSDPVFILRRAATYRTSSSSRNRLSAPLDDVALHHLQKRESVMSEQSVQSEYTSITESPRSPPAIKPPTQRDVIAEQRAARARQQERILNIEANSEEGVDLLLPDRGKIRSALGQGGRIYSYIEPDGETYDISDIIEEELWPDDEDDIVPATRHGQKSGKGDLLEDVLRKPQDVTAQRIDQVLQKIREGKRASSIAPRPSMEAESRNSLDDPTPVGRSPTPKGGALGRLQHQHDSRSSTPVLYGHGSSPDLNSSPSVNSEFNPDTSIGQKSSTTERTTPGTGSRPPIIMKDDFGFSKMMAVIEAAAVMKKSPPPPPISEIDEMLLGPKISLSELHPGARELFGPIFEQLEAVDKQLDLLLQSAYRP